MNYIIQNTRRFALDGIDADVLGSSAPAGR